ncbi:MAG: pyridoxamine 5'-phosphate oxidase family protein [Treponema sp.]|nr:pyridoxamine 5'-phosphate oxidase family protein [Treponema sp.]
MNIKDAVKIIQSSECAQIATFGKDETEGFPEIRALLNLANPKKYPRLKNKAISVDGETLTIYFTTNTSSQKVRQLRANNKACLYFVLPKKFKSVSAIGTIEEVTDQSVKEDFWQTGWFIYYHKGAKDPDYTLLKFTTQYLHCWGGGKVHDFGEPVNQATPGKKEDQRLETSVN